MVNRNISFARRVVHWSREMEHPDPRALACARWWGFGAGDGRGQVGTKDPLPADDAAMWRHSTYRVRSSAAAQPTNVLLPGQPLADAAREPPFGAPRAPRVRFCASTDPAASYRCCDPYLAGARYQRLLRVDAALTTLNGACRSALRERFTCPVPATLLRC